MALLEKKKSEVLIFPSCRRSCRNEARLQIHTLSFGQEWWHMPLVPPLGRYKQKEHSTSEARVRPVSIRMMVMILFDELWYYSTRDETQEKALTRPSLWLWSFPAVLMSRKPFRFPIWQPRVLKLRRLRPSYHGDLLKEDADWRLEGRLLSSHMYVHNSVFLKEGTVIWKIIPISPTANCSLHLNVHMESPEK